MAENLIERYLTDILRSLCSFAAIFRNVPLNRLANMESA